MCFELNEEERTEAVPPILCALNSYINRDKLLLPSVATCAATGDNREIQWPSNVSREIVRPFTDAVGISMKRVRACKSKWEVTRAPT